MVLIAVMISITVSIMISPIVMVSVAVAISPMAIMTVMEPPAAVQAEHHDHDNGGNEMLLHGNPPYFSSAVTIFAKYCEEVANGLRVIMKRELRKKPPRRRKAGLGCMVTGGIT